jgi:anhydro-N-acetylmuramic acid kinase
MFKETYTVIGVMSGTSLDGVDLAHIQFAIAEGKWTYKIRECETVSYDGYWLNKLRTAVDFSEADLAQLNTDYTQLLAGIITSFIQKQQLINLDAVCSHGHTILHQPHNGFTLQIGNLPELAALVGETVVCDFRVLDVHLGGQGAPLVPIGDRLLFADYDYCLNLGGFSNVSFEQNGQRIAFDIAPVNTVLNFYANQLGLDYDDGGSIARSGNLNEGLFAALNALDYYQKPYPKSLGFEYVKTVVLPLLETYPIALEDKLRTFTEHIAFQTGTALPNPQGSMLVTGGGAYNHYLVERMQHYLPQLELIIPQENTLEFKEALIFALLGVLKLRNEINVLSSVTGARHDHSSGMIYTAKA